MPKVIACLMGKTTIESIDMNLLSIKSIMDIADKIYLLIDKRSDKEAIYRIFELNDERIEIILNDYEHNNKEDNGRSRNKYLNILKEKHLGDWSICLDIDEVVGDNKHILLEAMTKDIECYSIRMIHFIRDLGHEDATVQGDLNTFNEKPMHYVLRRFFKIKEELFYPEIEHPVLQGIDESKFSFLNEPIIWHFGYAKDIFEIRNKYINHLQKSTTHPKQFLDLWYWKHLMGEYPNTEVKEKYPKEIKEWFMLGGE